MISNQIEIYSGASTYAFVGMVRPQIGINTKNYFGNNYVLISNFKYALPNKDPNGGSATTSSIYIGKVFHPFKYFYIRPYVGYQHLWYGPLYNNAIGGGVKFKIVYNNFFASTHIAALYGISGTVGYHLKHPGNLYTIYGDIGYRINKSLSVFTYITQQRYVNVGSYGCNSLTYQGVGLGLKFNY